MRSYVATSEVTAIIIMAHLSKDIDGLLEYKITKDEQKYLKYIRTYIDKYILSVKERIDVDASKRIARKVFNYVPRLEAINSNKHQRVNMIEDDFFDAAEIVIEKCCKDCKCENVDECSIRKCFTDAFVPELNLKRENRKCPYVFTLEDLCLSEESLKGNE